MLLSEKQGVGSSILPLATYNLKMYKKNYKKISVGIPTFNSSIYLKDCLRSLEKLVYIDEVIISDDCSNDIELDKINKIIKSYKEKLPIVFIKNSKNYGAFINKFNRILKMNSQRNHTFHWYL